MKYQAKTKKQLYHHDQWFVALFLVPSLLVLTVFSFYPLLRTIYLSLFLTNNRGKPSVFVGWQNYVTLFTSATFWQSMKATIIFVLAVDLLTVIIGTLLAQLATNQLPGIGFFRTTYSTTLGVSVSVAAVFWLFIFNPSMGVFDRLFNLFGISNIPWLTKPGWAMVAVIITTVWMNLGFTFLVVFGAMQGVPLDLYQFAEISGVSKWRQFIKITVPMISPTLFFVVVVTLIQAFKSFGIIDMMTTGGPNNATDLLVYRIYQDAFLNGNCSLASAEALVLTLIIAVFTWLQFKIEERWVEYLWKNVQSTILGPTWDWLS